MTQNYNDALAYITALTGSADTIIQWRGIHDTNKAVPAFNRAGTLMQVWAELIQWQNDGRGIFAIVNQTDGLGRETQNVNLVRAQYIDLDDVVQSAQRYQQAQDWALKPHFTVWSSPKKYHIYWLTEGYAPGEVFSDIQRRMIATFNSDPRIWTAERVMRVPGFYHLKDPANPYLITMNVASGWGGTRYMATAFSAVLAGVTPIEGGGGERSGLGDPKLGAPSIEWLQAALDRLDPNQMDRGEWIKNMAAFKQAGWLFGEAVIKPMWFNWCAQYQHNDVGENEKQWNDIRSTKAGWPALVKSSGLLAYQQFGNGPGQMPKPQDGTPPMPQTPAPGGELPPGPPIEIDQLGTFLTPAEQAIFFKGFTYVVSLNQILTPNGMFLDSGAFNSTFGGKQFVIKDEGNGSTTDEAWKAATRGQLFQIPKAHFTRFLPNMPLHDLIIDDFGRTAINTYRPANIEMMAGDPTPFVNHVRMLLPTENDVLIFLSYLAHCVQRPGIKAYWAPLIQSAEGAGKGIIKECMIRSVGRSYVHAPNAKELTEGGGKFNGWMEGKLLIVADEIRVDDKRDMIEVLKPMITEKTIEIQRKGVDQIIGDNVSNWIMFSNYKDAIPISEDSRRFAIFYSPLQSKVDLDARGMGEGGTYFPALWKWLDDGGYKIVAHYLKHFQIPDDLDPAGKAHRAPKTSSQAEAILQSRGRVEQVLSEAIEQGLPGFRGGWVSSAAASRVLKTEGLKVSPHVVKKAIETLGYKTIGRASAAYFQEEMKQPVLYSIDPAALVGMYPGAQGYA